MWRYGLVASAALVLLVAVSVDVIPGDDASDEVVGAAGGVLLLDALLGVVAVRLLPLRRRRPRVVATATAALTTASASAVAAAALAAVSLGTRANIRTTGTRAGGTVRSWWDIAGVGAVWVAATLLSELVWRPVVPGALPADAGTLLALCGLALAVYGACIAAGTAIGDRRRLVVSLQERAATAERQQRLEADLAREAERTRIAREMHDVLAHRMSLVALHAGALAYRADLTREQTAERAGDDRRQRTAGARRAAAGAGRPAGRRCRPRAPRRATPADAGRAPGAAGRRRGGGSAGAPRAGRPRRGRRRGAARTVSRTAFRIVQEALTNARKHAPSAPVRVRLAGAPGRGLQVEVRNRVLPAADADRSGAGVGLVGSAERAALAGGRLQHGRQGDEWVVRAELPWS